LPILQGPQGHGQAIGLWPLLQRCLHLEAFGLIQRRWATTP
jgi:hypothetical protein